MTGNHLDNDIGRGHLMIARNAEASEIPFALEPLSQIVFIHDYIQLVFQSRMLSIYNRAQVEVGGNVLTQDAPGFCDALVSLIGDSVRVAYICGRYKLTLEFSNGARFRVPAAAEHVRGPEAFVYGDGHDCALVEQNA